MNLSYSPVRRVSRVARPAALAILYPKVGNVLRVPLRRTRIGGLHGCAQHPERQFMQWFNRMVAARPGFPIQVKSILLLTDEPLCDSCRRVLNRYLGQYQLADKLRIRSLAEEPVVCGCQEERWLAPLLDEILLGEDNPKPAAPGIPEGVLGNNVYRTRALAYQGAMAEAARLHNLDPTARYTVVHDADQFSTHYHVVRNGERLKGHFMYGRPSHRVLSKDLPPKEQGQLHPAEQQQISAARAEKSASRRQKQRSRRQGPARELSGYSSSSYELPTSLRQLGRVGRFILGTAGALANPGPDMTPVPQVMVADGESIKERNKTRDAVSDNASSRRPPLSGPPPGFRAWLPLQGSRPMQLWPTASKGWRSR